MEDEFTNLMDVPPSNSPGRSTNGSDDDESSEHMSLPPPTTVNSVRDEVTSIRFARYLQQFDLDATKESVIFSSLPVASIDDGNRAQTLAMGIEKEDEAMQHQNDLDHIDVLKRRRMNEIDSRRAVEKIVQQRRLRDLKVKSNITTELVDTYYGHTSQELKIHLTARRAEVLQSVGEIRKFDRGDYDPDKPDWSTFEQQVELRVVSIRGLKNKIPRGEYIMLISKWDKMGGSPMRWSTRSETSKPPPPCPLHSDTKNMRVRKNCEICRGWAGATMPSVHNAQQTDYELGFDNRIFTFFPSERRIKPYMALVFELILLPKKRDGQPKVVGWSALPCVDSRFQIINGKFRFPMVRGAYSPDFGHHGDLMNFMYSDIENWLGNAYIDIFPHPREHYGRGEFTLQSDFTNSLLQLGHYPSAKDGDGWPADGRKRGASLDATNAPSAEKKVATFGGVSLEFDTDEAFPYERPEAVEYEETPAKTFWGIIRKAVTNRAEINKRLAAESHREAVKRAEQQKTFRFSIHPHGATNLESVWVTQAEYCVRGIMDELSLRQPGSARFWLNIIAFFIALYFQSFLHGCVLYTSLAVFGVPVQAASPGWAGVRIIYSHLNTSALEEFFFVFWAQLGGYILLLCLIMFGAIIRGGTGQIPEHLSKFVFTIGLSSFLVPWYELLTDLAPGMWGGESTGYSDIMRLHNWFTIHEYGGFFGYLVFALVYALIFIATFVSVFLYTMRLHLNGILQDAYWRIMIVNEDTYVIPEDLELSFKELKHILSSAERWRGMNGERRKIRVTKLITTDGLDDDYERVDLSIDIVQIDPKIYNTMDDETGDPMPTQKLFRSFYVLHTGAILESINKDVPTGLVFALSALKKTAKVSSETGVDDLQSFMGMNSVNKSQAFF